VVAGPPGPSPLEFPDFSFLGVSWKPRNHLIQLPSTSTHQFPLDRGSGPPCVSRWSGRPGGRPRPPAWPFPDVARRWLFSYASGVGGKSVLVFPPVGHGLSLSSVFFPPAFCCFGFLWSVLPFDLARFPQVIRWSAQRERLYSLRSGHPPPLARINTVPYMGHRAHRRRPSASAGVPGLALRTSTVGRPVRIFPAACRPRPASPAPWIWAYGLMARAPKPSRPPQLGAGVPWLMFSSPGFACGEHHTGAPVSSNWHRPATSLIIPGIVFSKVP